MFHYKKRNFPVAAVIETAQPLKSQEILSPQAQNLTMKPKVCWRSCYILVNPFLTPIRTHLMMANKKGISP